MLELVRTELGPDLGDLLVPLVNGGVRLHKIFGLMRDTCNTANGVAHLMTELRETKARAFYGDDAWDAADPCLKTVQDFLFGNHSRNLLVDRGNAYYDAYLEKELGEAMRAACVATGGRVRLECGRVFFAVHLSIDASWTRPIREGGRRRFRRLPGCSLPWA